MKKYLLIIILTAFISGCNSSIVDDPYIKINFSTHESGHVQLTVENSYETQIAVLIDRYLEAGNYSAGFDASDLAEGVYFYTLKITEGNGNVFESTKHMLLRK
jgi:hypothetical protein